MLMWWPVQNDRCSWANCVNRKRALNHRPTEGNGGFSKLLSLLSSSCFQSPDRSVRPYHRNNFIEYFQVKAICYQFIGPYNQCNHFDRLQLEQPNGMESTETKQFNRLVCMCRIALSFIVCFLMSYWLIWISTFRMASPHKHNSHQTNRSWFDLCCCCCSFHRYVLFFSLS